MVANVMVEEEEGDEGSSKRATVVAMVGPCVAMQTELRAVMAEEVQNWARPPSVGRLLMRERKHEEARLELLHSSFPFDLMGWAQIKREESWKFAKENQVLILVGQV